MLRRVFVALVLALVTASALAGCRAKGEVDPDGNVTTSVPAVR